MQTADKTDPHSLRLAAILALIALGACASDEGLDAQSRAGLAALAGERTANGRCFIVRDGVAEEGEEADGQVICPFVTLPAEDEPSQ